MPSIDWTKSMQQTFEYYEVEPSSWNDICRLDNIISCTVDRDADAETLGSASFEATEFVGEKYIRVYLIAIQNKFIYKNCLGTFLVQTPSSKFDGKIRTVTMDAYTPLLELKENMPAYGYTVPKGCNIMNYAYDLTKENVRPPVVKSDNDKEIYADFVANTNDTWLSYLADFISNADYTYGLDEMNRIIFNPVQSVEGLQPVWTYTDDNSSILYSDIEMEHDYYEVPNVVEAIYSEASEYLTVRVVNDDENSPVSTVNRGREIVERVVNPSLPGIPTSQNGLLNDYATSLLKSLSEVDYTVTYSHGYCPVRLGDCVRLNYRRAGITNVKAKVIYQSIKCETGCEVSEKATFTRKLWEG